nr:LuxR family transcriptional regulator [uncultured Gellertiella sp.]
MTIHSILETLVTTEECPTSAQVVTALEKLFNIYGFDFYGILSQPRPDQDGQLPFLASRWPEGWAQVYQAARYQLIDPAMRYLAVAQRPFRWKDALKAFKADPHRKHMERMMAEAARYGLTDGYIFPIHGRGGLIGWMTIGGKPIDLSPTEISLFQATAKAVYWKLRMLEEPSLTPQIADQVGPEITRRELEVLIHLADGLTSNDISRLLDISRHTVDWYMSGIQAKLGARNRQHAVAIALRTGLIG